MKKWLKRSRKKLFIILAVVGPGIITAFAGNDAGGVATYSVSAARFGYSMLTTIIPITIMLVITQELGARLAVVTGKGLGDLIRERYSVKVSIALFTLLFLVNFGIIIQDIGGLREALGLYNLNFYLFLPLILLFLFIFITKASFRKIENFFLFLLFFYIAYFISAVLAKPDWNLVFKSLVIPQEKITFGYLYTAIAVLGTTVTAWGQFFISSYVIDKKLTPDKLKYNRWEIYTGSILACLVLLFIMVAVTVTLYVNGISIVNGADAAIAIKPFAGELAGILFGFGLLNAGLIGTAIVPLATAYAFSEFFGFQGSLDEDFSTSKMFYIFFLVEIVLGAIVVMFPGFSLFKITLYANFLSGFFLPAIFFLLYKFANDEELMGSYKNTAFQNALLIGSAALITFASLAGVIGQVLGFA